MGAGLGAVLGLVSGGALSFAAGKYREKEAQKQQVKQLTLKGYFDDAQQNPEIVDNPEWQKGLKKELGDDEAFNGVLTHFKAHAGAVARQREMAGKFMASLFGMPGGGVGVGPAAQQAPTMGAPSAGPQMSLTSPAQSQAQPQQPPVRDFEGELRQLEIAKSQVGTFGFTPEQEKSVSATIDDRIKDLHTEMAHANDTPEAKAAVTRAQTKARIEEETNPDAIAAQSRLAGAKGNAEANARLGVESSLRAMQAAADKAAAEARARESVSTASETVAAEASKAAAIESAKKTVEQQVAAKADKSWTTKDALTARKSALDQASKEIDKGWFQTAKAHSAAVRQRAAETMVVSGLNPDNGQRLKDGEQITLPNGKTVIWKNDK